MRKCAIAFGNGGNKLDSGSRVLAKRHLEYIAADNPDAAVAVVDGIYEKAQVLLDFPRIGHRYTPVVHREIRILLYGHYRIAYLIKDDNQIHILGVFHGALEIERYLI